MKADIQAIRQMQRGVQYMASLPVRNLATSSWTATVPIDQFARMADIANEARAGITSSDVSQRPLDANHSHKMAQYILRAMVSAAVQSAKTDKGVDDAVVETLIKFSENLGGQPIFALQPFVASIRHPDRLDLHIVRDGNFEVLQIPSTTRLWVIDGQHRVHAIRAVSDFFSKIQSHNHYPRVRIGEESEFYLYGDANLPRTDVDGLAWRQVEYHYHQCDVATSIFADLDIAQERQLFHDLNNLGKSVDAGLAFEFDESNPINLWIKHELIPKLVKTSNIVSKDQKNWDNDTGKIVRKDLVAVNAFLFLRKTSVKSAEPSHVSSESSDVALRYWQQVLSVSGMLAPGAKKNVVLAQPVVQKALALIVNEYGMPLRKRSRNAIPEGQRRQQLEKILTAIPKIDWSHSNKLWRVWLDANPEKTFPGIEDFLPLDRAKAMGEFATIDASRVRFGVKHNEIAKALEGLIRYTLKLPAKPRRGRRTSVR